MKNIPRIFINEKLASGKNIPAEREIAHYLTRVMRTNNCLIFNNGLEFAAQISDDAKYLVIGEQTSHADPANGIIFCFAPIKRADEMLNMATQMGVAKLWPVITDRTVAHHINWARMTKIITEASEQSNRNSVPELLPPMKFDEFIKEIKASKIKLLFADERAAHGKDFAPVAPDKFSAVLIGPEGGFSDAEFDALDDAGALPISLGKTILRAEVASVAALAKMI